MPPHIARCLGEEGCRMLARELAYHRDATGKEILEIFIPGLVRSLLARCAREEQYHAEELQHVREECAAEVARAQASEAEWIADACGDWCSDWCKDAAEDVPQPSAAQLERAEQLKLAMIGLPPRA